ncbi:MAG: OmpA/MotB domain protein [Gemmatimonadetes bacterium]|nr:OmpA/MotB domain protein [Gemmatimonadota bacterium]
MHPHFRQFSALAVVAWSTGCASLNKKETGAIIGATAGAATGAMVGRANGSTAKGAIIGAAVGGTAGAVIGHQMDQQAKEIKQNIPGAIVERVGEGLQVTFESGLLFDYDSDVVRATARQNLSTLAASLEKYPNTDLVIVGHTDAQGTDSYNMTLSEKRAAAASSYLAAQGVARARLRSAGRGESEPVASNDTEAERQKNRRVEIAIYANETLKAQAKQAGTN